MNTQTSTPRIHAIASMKGWTLLHAPMPTS